MLKAPKTYLLTSFTCFLYTYFFSNWTCLLYSKSGDELKGDKAATPRSKCWPPSYRDPPPLIVTDYGVCRASTPINCPSVDDPERSGTTATVDAEPPDRRTSPASVPVITTTTTDEDDDELRLLATVDQRVDNVPSGMPLHVDGTAPALCEA